MKWPVANVKSGVYGAASKTLAVFIKWVQVVCSRPAQIGHLGFQVFKKVNECNGDITPTKKVASRDAQMQVAS